MNKIYKIMIVTGEASGDAHAAKLVKAICAGAPQIKFEFFGATRASATTVAIRAR